VAAVFGAQFTECARCSAQLSKKQSGQGKIQLRGPNNLITSWDADRSHGDGLLDALKADGIDIRTEILGNALPNKDQCHETETGSMM
jgi:hypothetical protein